VGQDDDEKLGFIEEALRHRQVPASSTPAMPSATTDDDTDDTSVDTTDDATDEQTPDEPAAPVAEADDPEPEPSPEPTPGPAAVRAPAEPFDTWPVDDRALVDEALKKAGLIWVRTTDRPRGHAYWHAWLDDRVYLLTGPGEQPGTSLVVGSEVSVVVASKDTSARLLTFGALVSDVRPDDADWATAAGALAAGRLNLPDPPGAPDRWAADDAVRLVRLTPSDPAGERPEAYGDAPERARPHPSPAATVGRLPRVVHRRHGSGRPLS